MKQELVIVKENEQYVEPKDYVREQELVTNIHMQVEFAQRVMFKAAFNIGKMLTESKEFIKHGQWENWVNERLGFKMRAAQNYMNLYKQYKEISIDDNSVFTSLGYSQALALLAVPAEDREDFAKEVNAKNLTIKELEAKIKDMQSQQVFKDKEVENIKAEKTKLEKENDTLSKDFALIFEKFVSSV